MNEKIWELAKQAGAETWSRPPFRAVTGVAFTDGGLQKFAELIVRECADFVREYPEKYLTHNQAREISFGMEEHFGVEE